jgi:hypothetical protein
MPHESDYTRFMVTPFGHLAVTQAGVLIRPISSLRTRLLADSSVLDLEPEQFASPPSLRRSLSRGR